MTSNSTSLLNLSISDINELAGEIGKECEKLIVAFGQENTNDIVTKCITALEMLELLSNERERTNCEIQELHDKIHQLEKGKLEKIENRMAFEKDLESIEEIWNTEAEDFRSKIKRLQDDNKKLLEVQNRLMSVGSKSPEASLESVTGTLYAEEYKMNARLKEQVRKLESELKLKVKENEVKDLEIKDISEELHELKLSQNQMRRQSRAMETQVKTLYEEREEILAEMHDQHKSFIILRDHLGMAQLENDDLAWRKLNDNERPRFTMSEMDAVMSERNELIEKVKKLEDELEELKIEDENKTQECEPKFKKVLQNFLTKNHKNFPQLWRKLVLESMSVSPLYKTPI